MSKGSNPTNVTTTTSSEPSEFIRPYYEQAINTAQDLFEGSTPNFFPNQTYVGFAPETETALNLATARAIKLKQKHLKFYLVIIYHRQLIHIQLPYLIKWLMM